MARLFADENFPLPVVTELRRLEHDVLTFSESGEAGQKVPDEAVLAMARAENRILLTLNRKHFIRLHAESPITAELSFAPSILILKGRRSEFIMPLKHNRI